MEDLQLTGFLTQTVPRGRHELVGQTATSWIVSTTLARSPYAAVRSYVRRGADHVHRYDMLDVRGDVVRRLEFADGALTVHTPADGTRTRLTPRR